MCNSTVHVNPQIMSHMFPCINNNMHSLRHLLLFLRNNNRVIFAVIVYIIMTSIVHDDASDAATYELPVKLL